MKPSPFILIVGPTGVGKSALALRLAQKYKGAILNCDSLQTYQRLDIGTAKPTTEERSHVPHLLFDILKPGELLTAGDYRRFALEQLKKYSEQIAQCSDPSPGPVFGVGGSGFYIQALIKGMFAVEKPDPELDQKVRQEVEDRGIEVLYEELGRFDPEARELISPNDHYRIIRAVVILRQTGKKVSQLREAFQPEPFPYPLLKLGLMMKRETLLPRIQERTRQMLVDGLVREVEALVKEGYGNWAPLQSVGYKECLQFLRGEIPEAKLQDLIVEKTMQLSKKQRTWFKRETDIHWLLPDNEQTLSSHSLEQSAGDVIARFLDSLS